jgi:hypothetical protein
MTHRFQRIRRFRFNRPQQIAAGLLSLFLLQALWLLSRQAFPVRNLLQQLPFLAAGFLLGGALWWVTRRLYGNLGGYTALALYCFSPIVLRACLAPNPELFAALGVFGGVYTCVGVAHAMQGPRSKWRPRIVLLTAAFALAATAHLAALAAAALLGLALMLWVAQGRRTHVLPVVLLAVAGALAFVFACQSFLPNLFSLPTDSLSLSLDPARRFFSELPNLGISLATAAAAVLYLSHSRSRYFGNTTPLLCALALILLLAQGSPWLWALPFLLTFIGGVYADAYEGPHSRIAIAAGASIILLQAVLCLLSLPRLL